MTDAPLEVISHGGEHLNEWCVIPENPFYFELILHPNPAGEPPPVAIWRLKGLPQPGLVLMFGAIRLGLPNWGGEHRLTVEIQEGGGAWSRAFKIGQGQENRYGLVWPHGDGEYVVRFTLELLDHAFYSGSVIGLAPFSYLHPVTESVPRFYKMAGVARPMTPRRSGKTLISANQGGMLNRMFPLLSTLITAERCEREPYVWWGVNAHCAAELGSIFDLTLSGIEEVDPSMVATSFAIHDAYVDNAPPLQLDAAELNTIVHSVEPFATVPPLQPKLTELGGAFRRFTLAPLIRHELAQFDEMDFSNVLGLHIRRPYPGTAFAELEASKFQLGLDVFCDLIVDVRRGMPDISRVLVCTNSFEAEEELRSRFGSFILSYKKTTIDNTVDARAVQEAVIDLHLLSRCPLLISQETTSFGRFAHILGENKLLCLTNGTTKEAYKFYRFDEGLHVSTFDVGRHVESFPDLRTLG